MIGLTKERDTGIYIHIPFCHNKCIYCDFPAYPNLEAYYDSYIEALCQEIRQRADGAVVSTMYFGGGTPTILRPEQLELLVKTIQEGFRLAPKLEMSIESNPGDYGREEFQALRSMGFNRISFGVQTFDNQVLSFLGRSHRAEDAYQAIAMAEACGFEDINLDLIYALPGQSLRDIGHNIEVAASLPINHISMYGLQLEEGTRLMTLVSQGAVSLPQEDQVDAMYEAMLNGLAHKGFERYEISNFSRNGHYSQHNLRYWLYKDYLGFGAGASSFYQGQRISNEANIVRYISRLAAQELPPRVVETIDNRRGPEDFCFLGLRTKWGIQGEQYQVLFGHAVEEDFGPIFDQLLQEGLLEKNGPDYRLTREGAKHGNYVFQQFLRD